MKRIAPAVALFLIAPLVAEFLLGDLPMAMLGSLIVLAPLYGGAALLIRETTRRSGRGWPSIFVLAAAYALFEEAFTTQTLFNPNYLHLNLHLLQPAWIPALGIGAWWTLNVLTLHIVWSISVSIALAESLVPSRAEDPWLPRGGLVAVAIIFLLGAAASTAITLRFDPFTASPMQFATSAVLCLMLTVIAFRLRPQAMARAAGVAPNPWPVAASGLISGSVFLLIPRDWAWAAVAIYVILYASMAALLVRWSHSAGWTQMHRLAMAGGLAAAYAWHAFIQTPAVGKVDRVGNAVFAALLAAFLTLAARRNRAHVRM